jgi:hypothetical protein
MSSSPGVPCIVCGSSLVLRTAWGEEVGQALPDAHLPC